MATTDKLGNITLSTGKVIDDIIGASAQLNIYCGYDNTLDVNIFEDITEEMKIFEDIIPIETVELAELMILRWIAIRDKWKGK